MTRNCSSRASNLPGLRALGCRACGNRHHADGLPTLLDDGAAGGGIAAEGNRAGCDAGNPGRRLRLGMRQELFYDGLGLQFRKS